MTKKQQGVFILSIGDELLDGRTANSNATWFGEQLRLNGVPVQEVRCVSDRIGEIVSALKEASRFPLVIATGGLGPTNDDRTMEAAAAAFRRPLRETGASLRQVRSRYAARGLELTPLRRRLALVPKGCRVIANSAGTAPGVELRAGGSRVFFLPGPPAECRPMFGREVLPAALRLKRKTLVQREFWRTFGLGESDVYQRVAPLVEKLESAYPETFTFGVHISFPCIDLTMEIWNVKGKRRPTSAEIERARAEISSALGNIVFTRDRESLVEAVSRILREKKLTLATAESCTGGMLGKSMTDLPGSSAYYLGGAVSYANHAKEKMLGVKPSTLKKWGAVSENTVREMAAGIRTRLGADFSLAISGVAGPGGGSREKPVGTTFVALSDRQGTKVVHQVILGGKGSRDQNRIIAMHLALDLLRNALREW